VLDLSPTKLLVIFVVVVVLLGPKRLPEVARQLGAGWRKLRELRLQVDQELRQSLPDLPSSHDIVRFARSPVSLLNELADRHDEGASTAADLASAGTASAAMVSTGTASAEMVSTGTASAEMVSTGTASAEMVSTGTADDRPGAIGRFDTDDPNLN
jgi:sec-independent protein translocase protein TatB